jgi:hypothetical protein
MTLPNVRTKYCLSRMKLINENKHWNHEVGSMFRSISKLGLPGMISKVFLVAPLCIMGVVSAATPATALGITGDIVTFKYIYNLTAHDSDSKEGIGSFTITANPNPGTPFQDMYFSPTESLGRNERHGTTSNHWWAATWKYNNPNPRAVEWLVFGLAELYPGVNMNDPPRDVSAATVFTEITKGGRFISYTTYATEKVPGPLPILGIGAAFGYTRKLQKRIKASKPEVISTTAV